MKKLLIATLFSLTIQQSVTPQVTPEDYKSADNLADRVAGKVFYADVRPGWIGNTSLFFYENNTPSGKDYIIVDARKLTRKKAFDQEKFADLFQGTGVRAEPGKLPITNILFSEGLEALLLFMISFNWICNLKDYAIERRDKVSPRILQAAGTGDSGMKRLENLLFPRTKNGLHSSGISMCISDLQKIRRNTS